MRVCIRVEIQVTVACYTYLEGLIFTFASPVLSLKDSFLRSRLYELWGTGNVEYKDVHIFYLLMNYSPHNPLN